MFFCHGSLHARGSGHYPLFVCRDHSTPPLLICKRGTGSAGFRSSHADIFGFWFAAQTALTLISHVSLQVYRKVASMFTTYPLPAEVHMFAASEVSLANAHCSGMGKRTSRVRSVARTVSSVGQRSSSVVASLFWRSPIVELSQFLTQASRSHGRRIWFAESRGQPCVCNNELLGEFSVLSAVIGVFAGLTSASVRTYRKRASYSRFVEGASSWSRRLVESQSGQGSREAPGPSVPGRVGFAPSRWRVFKFGRG